jgi:hypothetical protein
MAVIVFSAIEHYEPKPICLQIESGDRWRVVL